jgi:pimeloyl-ACP methyl ester carboxylesterase
MGSDGKSERPAMARPSDPHSPVVILGGFLMPSQAYGPMAEVIGAATGGVVEVVPATRVDWLLTAWAFGWRRLLDRVDARVRALAEASPSQKVTLVGHSSGAVMLRLYLGDEPFAGRSYGGAARCGRLVMLGGPHQAVRGSPLRAMVDRRYPGCFFADRVEYVSVAGRLDLASDTATPFARRSAARSYRTIAGDAEAEGDGLVPVRSALLDGSRTLVLEDTAHGGWIGSPWYGSPDRVGQWWPPP